MTLTLTFSIKGTKMTTAQNIRVRRSRMQTVCISEVLKGWYTLDLEVFLPKYQSSGFCRNYRNINKYLTKPFVNNDIPPPIQLFNFINKVSNVSNGFRRFTWYENGFVSRIWGFEEGCFENADRRRLPNMRKWSTAWKDSLVSVFEASSSM